MWFSLSEQTAYFLWSLVLGLATGALYDIVRAVRMLTRARGPGVMISDIVFFAVCGVITSLFALPFNKGDVRAFIIFGEAVGFLAYRLTIGSIMGKIYLRISSFLRIIIQKAGKILEKIFNFLLKAWSFVLYNVGVVIDRLHTAANKRKAQRHAAAKAKQADTARKRKDRYNEQKKHKKAVRGSKGKGRKERPKA